MTCVCRSYHIFPFAIDGDGEPIQLHKRRAMDMERTLFFVWNSLEFLDPAKSLLRRIQWNDDQMAGNHVLGVPHKHIATMLGLAQLASLQLERIDSIIHWLSKFPNAANSIE